MLDSLCFARIGLILNVVGSIMIAVSFGKPPSTAEQRDEKGRRISLAAFRHPCLFNWGLLILVFGFCLSFAATFSH